MYIKLPVMLIGLRAKSSWSVFTYARDNSKALPVFTNASMIPLFQRKIVSASNLHRCVLHAIPDLTELITTMERIKDEVDLIALNPQPTPTAGLQMWFTPDDFLGVLNRQLESQKQCKNHPPHST